jgi:hypothetical protein
MLFFLSNYENFVSYSNLHKLFYNNFIVFEQEILKLEIECLFYLIDKYEFINKQNIKVDKEVIRFDGIDGMNKVSIKINYINIYNIISTKNDIVEILKNDEKFMSLLKRINFKKILLNHDSEIQSRPRIVDEESYSVEKIINLFNVDFKQDKKIYLSCYKELNKFLSGLKEVKKIKKYFK